MVDGNREGSGYEDLGGYVLDSREALKFKVAMEAVKWNIVSLGEPILRKAEADRRRKRRFWIFNRDGPQSTIGPDVLSQHYEKASYSFPYIYCRPRIAWRQDSGNVRTFSCL